METIVLISHPRFNTSSCCKFIQKDFEQKEKTKVILLDKVYKAYPQEKDINSLQADIKPVKNIVLVFPIWWYQAPASMKMFFDDVVGTGEDFLKSLKGKNLYIICTAGGEANHFKSGSIPGSIEDLMRPYKASCQYIGINYLGSTCVFGCGMGVRLLSDSEKEGLKNAIKECLEKIKA